MPLHKAKQQQSNCVGWFDIKPTLSWWKQPPRVFHRINNFNNLSQYKIKAVAHLTELLKFSQEMAVCRCVSSLISRCHRCIQMNRVVFTYNITIMSIQCYSNNTSHSHNCSFYMTNKIQSSTNIRIMHLVSLKQVNKWQETVRWLMKIRFWVQQRHKSNQRSKSYQKCHTDHSTDSMA